MLDLHSPFAVTAGPRADYKMTVALKRLRHALITCELLPGHSYSEAELADRFGLTRAAVRVALATLAAEHWLSPQHRLGWEVTAVTGVLVGDVLRARGLLEPALAHVALHDSKYDALLGLAGIAPVLAKHDDRALLATLYDSERKVMETLAHTLGGMAARWLIEAWDQSTRIAYFFGLAGRYYRPPERESLLQALRRRDAATASAQIEAGLLQFEEYVTACLLTAPSPVAHVPVAPVPRRRGAARRPGKQAL